MSEGPKLKSQDGKRSRKLSTACPVQRHLFLINCREAFIASPWRWHLLMRGFSNCWIVLNLIFFTKIINLIMLTTPVAAYSWLSIYLTLKCSNPNENRKILVKLKKYWLLFHRSSLLLHCIFLAAGRVWFLLTFYYDRIENNLLCLAAV